MAATRALVIRLGRVFEAEATRQSLLADELLRVVAGYSPEAIERAGGFLVQESTYWPRLSAVVKALERAEAVQASVRAVAPPPMTDDDWSHVVCCWLVGSVVQRRAYSAFDQSIADRPLVAEGELEAAIRYAPQPALDEAMRMVGAADKIDRPHPNTWAGRIRWARRYGVPKTKDGKTIAQREALLRSLAAPPREYAR